MKSRDRVFFFFQAEDGIRDYKVTGVQTCALPISAAVWLVRRGDGERVVYFGRLQARRRGSCAAGRRQSGLPRRDLIQQPVLAGRRRRGPRGRGPRGGGGGGGGAGAPRRGGRGRASRPRTC